MDPISTTRRLIVRSTLNGLGMAALVPTAGCGTLFYPHRRGRTGGRVDPGLILLNGIGLFFFIIPGVIAFAVDFATGAIYLAPGETGILGSNDEVRERKIALPVREDRLKALLQQETGRAIDLAACQCTEAEDLSREQIETVLRSFGTTTPRT